VDRLADEVPAHLLTEWAAYWQLEPTGAEAADARWAMLLALTANQNRKKGGPRIKVDKFRLMKAPEESESEPRSMFQNLKTYLLGTKD
jgi:hypothetical protein